MLSYKTLRFQIFHRHHRWAVFLIYFSQDNNAYCWNDKKCLRVIFCVLFICLFVFLCRRGLIMGIWNSHTSVGNILGSLIAAYWVSTCWGLSFVMPGVIIAVMGIFCFLFLIERKCFSVIESWRGSLWWKNSSSLITMSQGIVKEYSSRYTSTETTYS